MMNPTLFFMQVLLLAALGLTVALFGLRGSSGPASRRGFKDLDPLVDRERYVATGLGIEFRTWVLLRASTIALALALGLLVGTPVVILGSTALAVFGLPWLLTARAAQRKLEMDRALIPFMISVVNLLSQGQQTLDQALKELAKNPDSPLAYALEPLRHTESVSEALVQVARRGLSPMLERTCVDLLLSLDQTPEAFIEQAERILIPQYDQDLEIQTRNHAALAGGRQNGLIVILIMALAFFAVMRVDSLRVAYTTLFGQVMLVIDASMVMGILWLLSRLTPRSAWVRWDVAAVVEQMRRRYS
jgi:Flp pilus assembly protein TadB